MYRPILESLLGLHLDQERLHVAPGLPAHWSGFTIHYRYRETVYHIAITRIRAQEGGTRGGTRVTVDGVVQGSPSIPDVDDHREHWVEVSVPAA